MPSSDRHRRGSQRPHRQHRRRRTVNQFGELAARCRWATRRSGRRLVVDDDRLDLVDRPHAEAQQALGDVGVVGLHPVLAKLVGTGSLRREPHRGAGRLAELLPVAASSSGHVTPWAVPPEVLRIRSIPAVMLPHWSEPPICKLDAVLVVKMSEVVGLQEHVAELGERDPVLAVEARPARTPWPSSD